MKRTISYIGVLILGIAIGGMSHNYFSNVLWNSMKERLQGSSATFAQSSVIQSDEKNVNWEVDLSLLASIPLRRQEALVKMQDTTIDSSTDSIEKMMKYYETLKEIINELKFPKKIIMPPCGVVRLPEN